MRKLLRKIMLISAAFMVVIVFLVYNSPLAYKLPWYHSFLYSQSDYLELQSSIQNSQSRMVEIYTKNENKDEQEILLLNASDSLIEYMDEAFNYWYGTPWAFNGTSQIPGKGSVACGYFVTTILRDVGFKVERRAWAQLASESLIRKLIDKKHIRIFGNTELDDFLVAVQDMGDGMYIVGLDTHIGFLLCTNGYVYFIHSSQRGIAGVRKESAYRSKTLKKSKYRVVGKLSADTKKAMKNWLRVKK